MEVTADLINTFNISMVVRGSVSETRRSKDGTRYAVPRQQGIFRWAVSAEMPTSVHNTAAHCIDCYRFYNRMWRYLCKVWLRLRML